MAVADARYGQPESFEGVEVTLRVHVPYEYILGPQSPYIGGTLIRPKYTLIV